MKRWKARENSPELNESAGKLAGVKWRLVCTWLARIRASYVWLIDAYCGNVANTNFANAKTMQESCPGYKTTTLTSLPLLNFPRQIQCSDWKVHGLENKEQNTKLTCEPCFTEDCSIGTSHYWTNWCENQRPCRTTIYSPKQHKAGKSWVFRRTWTCQRIFHVFAWTWTFFIFISIYFLHI